MWLFNLFQKGSKANKGIFVKKNEYKRNLTLQKKMSIKTIQQLENSLNGQVDRLNLEFFFIQITNKKQRNYKRLCFRSATFLKFKKLAMKRAFI